ncbi:MAG: N-6 DNA methylase [Treponema sp.]|nr:N-6 DNA methylase [Treponema sp.]
MSLAKYFYVDKAMEKFNFPTGKEYAEVCRIANLVIPFAAFVAKKNELSLSLTISEVVSQKGVPSDVKDYVNEDIFRWRDCTLESFENVKAEDISAYITERIEEWNFRYDMRDSSITFPESLNGFSSQILDVQKNDSVMDLGAGRGSFLIHVAKNYQCKNLTGIEINKRGCLFGSMLSYIENVFVNLVCGDVLELDEKNKVEKLLSFPPINSDVTIPFIKKAVALISKTGRGVLYLSRGFLSNEKDEYKEIRRFLIESGLVEAVIEFAGGVLTYSLIQTAMIVLSHNNKSVRFVNASSVSENTRRGQSVLTQDGVKEIFEMLKKDGRDSKSIDVEKIRAQNYVLTPGSYLLEEKITLGGVSDYAKLSDLVESKIVRGAQIKAQELEELQSEKDTGFFYASAKDIVDNSLAAGLKPIKQIDKKFENLVLKEGDILLVMAMTETIKLSYIEKIGDKKIIPAGNLYIIRPDKTKLEGLYLKMLFETKEAVPLFTAFSGGTVLRAISADFLNKLQIPLPPLEVQKKLAKRYAGIEAKREQLKNELESLAVQKSQILDELLEPDP